ncbi:FtsX-like permease family protein [Streptococcus parauberis]|nr:FtsX-like permease family protein [Streptococcus parauberis]
MFLRILKNDFNRKRVMNLILLLFIILATTFVSSGINNLVTVYKGVDYYFDKAEIGNFDLISMGEDPKDKVEAFLAKEKAVSKYKVEPIIFLNKDDFSVRGKKSQARNDIILQSIEESKINFFDSANKNIKTVKPGHVYIGGSFIKDNNLSVGDTIIFKKGKTEIKFILDGKAKDALLGSEMFGNCRFIINTNEKNKLLENKEIASKRQGKIAYVVSNNLKRMEAATAELESISFTGSRWMMKFGYVMDMIVAFIILILSICLILVAFTVLKFSINFTILEEFREIGVMKAIGIGNGKIRYLYIIKYLVLACIGSLIGFFSSLPFGKMLIQSATENMVLENDLGIFPNLLGTLLVIFLIVWFSYLSTSKIKKSSPLDAIRSGQTGERYKTKAILRFEKSSAKPSLFLAVTDIVNNPRRFLTIILSFFLCTLFVLIMVNTTETINSDKLITIIGARADLYLADDDQVNKDLNQKDMKKLKANLAETNKKVEALGMYSRMSTDVVYKYKVNFEGNGYFLNFKQGVNSKVSQLKYTKGSAPQNGHEIAITSIISKMTGAKIGDTLIVNFGEKEEKCIVTAYYQTMNQLGQVILLHEDAPSVMKNATIVLPYKINFTDQPDEAQIKKRQKRLKTLFPQKDIMTAKEYCMDSFGIGEVLNSLLILLLTIVLIVVSLVTLLTERVFISNEKNQIAILKAIGFQNSSIMKWHIYRFIIVGVVAVALAAITSIPITKLCISPLFGMMGANDVSFNIVAWKVFGLYPGLIVIVTIFVATLSAQYIRSIKSSDTANIE